MDGSPVLLITVQDGIMEFKSARSGLPSPLDTTRKSLILESMNRSDDAFMFIKKKITGLEPNKEYSLLFEIELASRYGTNSVGIGGSPGGSVYLKAGATSVEPVKELKAGFYSLNVDKGAQNNDGTAAILLGNIGAGDDVTDSNSSRTPMLISRLWPRPMPRVNFGCLSGLIQDSRGLQRCTTAALKWQRKALTDRRLTDLFNVTNATTRRSGIRCLRLGTLT